jgi:hypothetical protein
VRISVLFSRICLLWLFYSQALYAISLWQVESDVCELFGSQAIDGVFRRLFGIVNVGTIVLLILGVSLVALYGARERRFGFNTAWSLSGIIFTVLVFVGAVLIWWGEPDYYLPPPGLEQYVRLGIMVALDIVVGIALLRCFGKLFPETARPTDAIWKENQ